MFYPIIQPGLLSSNTSVPLSGLECGQMYQAAHPKGLPNPLIVMYIQASAKITYTGMLLRQQASILTSEGALSTTSGTTSTAVDVDCGITESWIPGTEDQMAGTFTNHGYFIWKDDATATVDEIGQVARYNGDGSSTGTFHLSADHLFDTVAATDKYIVFKPGRMLLTVAAELKPIWGVSCAPITDEYYGFMVVRGFWYVLADTDKDAPADMVAGEPIIGSDDSAGYAQSGTVGTDDGVSIGMPLFASNSVAATTLQLVPAYIRGFPA